MKPAFPTSYRSSAAAFAFVLIFLAACMDATTLAPMDSAALAASSGDPTVTSTDPTAAPQDTTLDIKVNGSGFDRGSWVDLALSGELSPKVTTNSTRYVNSKQLIANVTIAADAATGTYDVIVTTSSRKTGIGTEMFEVKTRGQINNPHSMFTYYDLQSTSTGGGIRGDGRNADGSARASGSTETVYDDGKCGVTSEIFANRTGDATMDPIGSRVSTRNCTSTKARSLTVRYGTPLAGASVSDAVAGHFNNVREVFYMIGSEEERIFTLLLRNSTDCERVRYDNVSYGGFSGRKIKVTRISNTEWIAESQPDTQGRHIAFCQVGGDKDNPGTLLGAYDVPFKIRVVQKQP